MTAIFETMRAFPQVLQAIGVLGFFLYVGAFAAIQSGRLCGNGIIFSTNQVIAASCVLISLLGAFNLGSFLIQVSYIGIGTCGIVVRRQHARSSALKLCRPDRTSGSVLVPSI